MPDKDLAWAELKLFEDIIARQDGFKDKTKTLAITLFTAVSVGYFSGQLTLANWQYFLSSLGVFAVFIVLEGVYGITEINAEQRIRELEGFLQGAEGSRYSGPVISQTLHNESFENMRKSIWRWRTRFPYIFLVVLSGLAALFVPPSTTSSRQSTEKQLSQLFSATARLDQTANDLNRRLAALVTVPAPDKPTPPVTISERSAAKGPSKKHVHKVDAH